MLEDNDLKYAYMAGSYGALVEMFCNDVERLLNAKTDAQKFTARADLKLLVEQARESIARNKS